MGAQDLLYSLAATLLFGWLLVLASRSPEPPPVGAAPPAWRPRVVATAEVDGRRFHILAHPGPPAIGVAVSADEAD